MVFCDWLLLFNIVFSKSIHVVACIIFHCQTIFHGMGIHLPILCIHPLMDIWVVSTFFGCYELCSMNIHIQVFRWTYVFFFLDICLEFLSHVVTEELPDLLSKWLYYFTILTMYKVSNFFASSPSLAIIFLLDYRHSSKVWSGACHSIFNFHFHHI